MNALIRCLLLSARDSSPCTRKQVGAVLELPDGDCIPSYNYNSSGQCEDENGETLDTTIHAEIDVLLKAAKLPISTAGATMYITSIPCKHCAEAISRAGISIVYIPKNDKLRGLNILKQNNINIRWLDI